MSKITGFFDTLKKSTKITVLSCGSFVVMTLLILAFFILFPITPSEKIMTNIGRGENMYQDDGQPVQSGVPEVETTVSTTVTTKATTTRVTTTRVHTSFTITLTTGSGFMWNGRIPTGGIPGYTETVTTPVDPSEPYVDPNNPNGDPNLPNPTDPNQGGPIDPNQGGTPDPNQGENVDPNPGITPNPNQGGNGDPNPGITPDPVVPDTGGDSGTW